MIRLACVFILSLLLGGCSSARLSYGFLDNWLQWRIGDYVELSNEQQQFANEQLKAFHHWHRQTQLPAYSEFIERTISLIERESINTEDLNLHLSQAGQLWDNSVEYILPSAVALLEQLDQPQREKVLQNIQARQSRERDKIKQLTPEQKQNERRKNTEERLTQWLGSIKPAQQRALRRWANQIKAMDDTRDQRQLVWNQAFNELVVKSDGDFSLEYARQLFIDPEQFWPKSYTERFDYNKALLLNLIVNIHSQMDNTQKQFLIRRLKNYQTDFNFLAAR